ncbi:MAG: hypothetical protein KIT72_09545 [Polyangiaceae bacterium]|nr:hypothetical protein [Polyangiaceae bacterium]MCW5790651.1 hypothetical protein [Polyangiaceae bacterium]
MRFSWFLGLTFASLAAVATADAAPGAPAPKPPARGEALQYSEHPAPSSVKLTVTQHGPELPWRYQLTNFGEHPVVVVADPRLLWFEVEVPGKRTKRRTCRLPEGLFPKAVDRDFAILLRPGDTFEQRFDPRLYCFAAGGQTELVAGSVVHPRFGWPRVYTTSWQRGKAVKTEKLSAPFVVSPPEPPRAERARSAQSRRAGAAAEATAAAKAKRPAPSLSTHLRSIEGQGFGLKSAYAGWSKDALSPDGALSPEASQADEDDPFSPPTPQLTAMVGSDAEAERTATITIQLKNPSRERSLSVFFRRELLSFEVMGPDGLRTCEPEPRTRAPEAQSFTTLGPGKSIQVVSRLVELCPRRTFDRPGLYLVRARLDAQTRGDDAGVDAFTGRVVASAPASVRIRSGEKRFVLPRR